ncbi:MAG: 4Fe-4S dicluster domain-containing protein [Desulfobacterales bacterium]|nr:4Fe-4S dicluster domain-containing protein [Desulfobacterales bacterium]
MMDAAVKINQPVIRPDVDNRGFTQRVISRSRVNTGLCWQCKCCSSGCPFSDAMDYLPNQVIRMVQLGMKKEVLSCSAIWLCVGCHTCSMECPTAIDMAAVMDALRQTAIEEKFVIAEPDILNFHKEVVNSIYRYGRTHKLEIMLRYKLTTRRFLADMDVGLRMFSKRKLDLRPSKVHHIASVRRMFGQQRGARP